MMKLTAKKKTFDVNYTLPQGKGEKLVISMKSGEMLSVIAGALEGCAELRVTDENKPGVTELYEGYTALTSIQRLSTDSVRVTLARE